MYIAGIDIGGTTVKIGIFDLNYQLIEKWEIETKDNILKDIYSSIKDKYDLSRIKGYGFGIPGVVIDNKIIVTPNIKIETNACEIFRKLVKNENVFLANDANVAALGEAMNQKLDSAIFITLGTGVGGGIVINGQIHEGFGGSAGEFGHLKKYSDIKCNCGGIGCLETVCSAKALEKMAGVSTKEIFKNTALYSEILNDFYDKLGLAIANILAVVNTENVIIGGGLSNAKDELLNGIYESFKKHAFLPLLNTRFRLSSLFNDAGIYGAAYLVR